LSERLNRKGLQMASHGKMGAQLDLKYKRGATKAYDCVCPTCKEPHKIKSSMPHGKWVYCDKCKGNRNRTNEGYGYLGESR
jgi:hypothetical protein